jgi:predicted dehydrogenase
MSFQFKTETGVDGVFNVFFSTNGYAENRIIILGTDGSIIVENNDIILKKHEAQDQTEHVEDDGGYKGQFVDFYEAIRNKKHVKSSFSEAYQDFVTILRALESAEKNMVFNNR